MLDMGTGRLAYQKGLEPVDINRKYLQAGGKRVDEASLSELEIKRQSLLKEMAKPLLK